MLYKIGIGDHILGRVLICHFTIPNIHYFKKIQEVALPSNCRLSNEELICRKCDNKTIVGRLPLLIVSVETGSQFTFCVL